MISNLILEYSNSQLKEALQCASPSTPAFPLARRLQRNQLRELQAVAERSGWQVVARFTDEGISGAKGVINVPV